MVNVDALLNIGNATDPDNVYNGKKCKHLTNKDQFSSWDVHIMKLMRQRSITNRNRSI